MYAMMSVTDPEVVEVKYETDWALASFWSWRVPIAVFPKVVKVGVCVGVGVGVGVAVGAGVPVGLGVGVGVAVGAGVPVGLGVGVGVAVGVGVEVVLAAYMLMDPVLSVPNFIPNGFAKPAV
jgi:hypothetical protein